MPVTVIDLVPTLIARGLIAPTTPNSEEWAAENSPPPFEDYWRVFVPESGQDSVVANLTKVRDGHSLMAPLTTIIFEEEEDVEECLLSLAAYARSLGVDTGQLIRSELTYQIYAIKYPFLFRMICAMNPAANLTEPLIAMLCGKSADEVAISIDVTRVDERPWSK